MYNKQNSRYILNYAFKKRHNHFQSNIYEYYMNNELKEASINNICNNASRKL